MEDHICKMGYCMNPVNTSKDICDPCYRKFRGELGVQMSEVTRLMVKRARERGKYPVEISKDDIYQVWPTDNTCPIMGTQFTIGGNLDTSPSLDRVDPTFGYILGNIQIISNVANRMKNSADDEQLLKFAHYYIEYYRKVYDESNGSGDQPVDIHVQSEPEADAD